MQQLRIVFEVIDIRFGSFEFRNGPTGPTDLTSSTSPTGPTGPTGLSDTDGSVLTTCILDNRMPKVSKRMLTDKTFRRI